MGYKARDPKLRFWEKVDKSTDCWNWTGSKYYNGYGQFFDGKNKICAHRFAYKTKFGEFYRDLVVCHKCDNRSCVNPDHLFLGTQKDNLDDMDAKGRRVVADTSGSKNGRAVVDEATVLEMRKLYDEKSLSIIKIGKKFGVSETQTHRIVKKESWRKI